MTYPNNEQHNFHPRDYPQAYPQSYDGAPVDARIGVDPNLYADDYQYHQRLQQIRDQEIVGFEGDQRAADYRVHVRRTTEYRDIAQEERRLAEKREAELAANAAVNAKIYEMNKSRYEKAIGKPYLPNPEASRRMNRKEQSDWEATREADWTQYHRDRISGKLPKPELHWVTGTDPLIGRPVDEATTADKSLQANSLGKRFSLTAMMRMIDKRLQS